MNESQEYTHTTSRDVIRRDYASEAGPPRIQYTDTVEIEAGEGSESHELLEYWQILRRRKAIFIFISFLGALAGLLVTLPQPPVYQAHASLEISMPNENVLNLREAVGSTSVFEYQDSYLQTQVRILQSTSLRQRVTAKLETQSRPQVAAPTGRLAAWLRILGLSKPAVVPTLDAPAPLPWAAVQIRIAPNTRIVDLSCDSSDPAFAAEFVNTLATEYIAQNISFRTSGTDQTKGWLAEQLRDLKAKLEKSEQALQAYSNTSGLMFTSEKDSVTQDNLKQLQGQLSAAHGERVAKQSQYETATTNSIESLPEVLDSGPIGEYQGKLAELRREEAQLLHIYTPVHYRVKRVQVQIAEVEAQLKSERKNIIARLRDEYESALRREKLLTEAFGRQSRRVTDESSKTIQYGLMKREVDTNRQLYESMLQKVNETGIASAVQVSNARLIDPAKPPGGPYKPNLSLNISLGLLSGVFIGLVFVFIREHADLSLKAPGDTSFYLKVPELGVVPVSSAPATRTAYGDHKAMAPGWPLSKANGTAAAGNGEPKTESETPSEAVEMVTWQHKPSLVAESFRAALTSIMLSGQNGSRPRMLVFTSAGPGEGKTTTVCNLGIAIAEINRRVLLIDADMRKPRLHSVFDLPNTWGLSDLLREKSPIDSRPREALVRQTSVPNLFVLPSGPATVSISNLLYSPRTAELLHMFRNEFDTILIDTPPMMQISDARVLGRLADAVILVVGAGRTTRDAAKAAKQRLVEDGIFILGTILNRWDPKSSSSYGVYGYYDGYYAKKSG